MHLLADDLPSNDVLDSLDKVAVGAKHGDEPRGNDVVVAAAR